MNEQQVYCAAIDLAIQKHATQLYGKHPYMYHVWQVHDLVATTYGVDALKECTVALLHDVIEDTDYTEEQLYKDFPKDIADGVIAMTKKEGEDYFEYIDRVKKNPLARKVKGCDSMCNLMQSFKERRHKGIIKYTTVLQLLEAD